MATAEVQRTREYETIYVLSPTTSKDASEKVAARVEEVLGREGGRLTLVENWGRRQLAYPVTKHTRGVYVYMKYTGNGSVVNELERNFRMVDDVLKFQTVKVRDDVNPAELEVDQEAVKFESIEPALEDETEETLEQKLGLVEPSAGSYNKSDNSDTDGDENEGGSARDGDKQATEGKADKADKADSKTDGNEEEEE